MNSGPDLVRVEEAATRHALEPVLRPRSVAVVGASPDPTKRGHHAVRALIESGYRGRIIPVHPAGGELLGLPVARGVADLDAPVELALLCTPAATIPSVLEEWARAGARGAVVLAAGFGESGEGGAALEAAVRDVARRTGIRVIGPNTSGILNVPIGLNLIGLRDVRPGGLALLVQSGNMALQLVTEAGERTEQGFSYCIGAGNETDLAFHEYVEFLGQDEGTTVILMHAEGMRDGRRFLEAAARVSRSKPIVLVKGGRTEAGGAAARSHTGAVSGSYATLRAGLRQAGVVEVARTDELLHVGETLATQPPVRAPRGIAILSDGGGHATLAVDDLHDRGIRLATLGAETRDRLRALLGIAASVFNPVDLAGAADRDPVVFAHALDVLAGDEAVGGVLVAGLFGGYAIRFASSLLDGERVAADAMARTAANAGVALVVHTLYAGTRSDPLRTLQRAGVPVVGSLDVACRCIAALCERGALLDRGTARPWRAVDASMGPAGGAVPDAFAKAAAEGRRVLLEPEGRALVGEHGVPLVPSEMCASADEAAAAAGRIGGTVVVRVVTPAAPHKTDAGGVALNVEAADAADAYARVTAAVSAWAEGRGVDPDIRGALVAPMLPRPLAELLVGVVRDPQFGPVLTVGAGGTAVEVLRDVGIRVLPVMRADVDEMLAELRMAPLLEGARGRPAADREAIIDAVMGMVRTALAHEGIAEIEANPVFAYADRAVAVDLRVYLG